MIEWLFGLDYYHWILFGLVLLIAEVFVGGSFLMWIGFSALVLGLLLLLLPLVGIHLGWEWQLVLFGIQYCAYRTIFGTGGPIVEAAGEASEGDDDSQLVA